MQSKRSDRLKHTILIMFLAAVFITAFHAVAEEIAEEKFLAGQRALDRSNYQKAVELFHQAYITDRTAALAGDALYWHAFALYRMGGTVDLRNAIEQLELQRAEHPDALTIGDAEELAARIKGELASRGDMEAAMKLAMESEKEISENEIKLATLEALIRMKSSRAIPTIEKILKKREKENQELRREVLWLVAQTETEEAADLLLDVAKNDPEPEVREEAVFWLSQVSSEKAVEYLEQVIRTSKDPEVLEEAVFALVQQESDRTWEILNALVLDDNTPPDLRAEAIHWMGMDGGEDQIVFLKNLYGTLDDEELKAEIVFIVSQSSHAENEGPWLLGIAFNKDESLEVRQAALHVAGANGMISAAEIAERYETIVDPEMREQVYYVLTQTKDPMALDLLIRIAKEEKDIELKKNAIFWIGQFDDPRVEQFLLDIIEE